MSQQYDSQPRRTRKERVRARTSCETCHQRKVKCDRKQPCNQCTRHSIQHECRYNNRASVVRHSPVREEAATYVGSNLPNKSLTTWESSERSDARLNSALVHKWVGADNVRGRSHYSWLVKKFDPLISQYNLRTSGTGPWSESRAYPESASETAFRHEVEQNNSLYPPTLYDELPDHETSQWLIDRFFETFGTVFSILHPATFYESYTRMRENEGGTNVCFMVQLLLVLSLANATLANSRAVFRRVTILSWINLAEGLPQTAMHMRSFDIETVRMWALITLSEQMCIFDDFADYVFSGAALRAGAALGLHHTRTWDSSGERRGLWEALLELDLQACFAAGMPPSVSYFVNQSPVPAIDENHSSSLSLERARLSLTSDLDLGLSTSLDCRFRIVQTLNTPTDISLENALDLSRELTKTMRPVVETASGRASTKSFQQRFAAHVYAKFLAALHSPFAMIDSPAFHYSRNIALSLARRNITEMIKLYAQESEPDAFDCLQLGVGIFCRAQSIPAFLLLCWELKMSADKSDHLDVMSSWIGPSLDINGQSSAIYSKVRELLPFVKGNIQSEDMAARAYAIGSMTAAHYEISHECEIGSDEYLRRMRESASALPACVQSGCPI